jgi:hypothetical protein
MRIKLFFSIPFVLLLCFNTFSQELGKIEVNINNSATLTFAFPIDFIVFGNNPETGNGSYLHYDFIKDKNVCVIRGNHKEAPETSLTIKLSDGSVWYGKILFGDNTKILYDFSAQKKLELETQKLIEQNATKEIEGREREKLLSLFRVKDEYFSIGEVEGGIDFQITKLRNDENNTFLILKINNQSGSIYTVDGILFKYIQGKRKGVKKGEARIEERISPKIIEGNLSVAAYKTENLGIIIPVFAIGKKGRMEITIREKDGTRNVIINIPGSVMEKVKVF